MLKRLTFKEDYRCFKKGFSIDFHPGINLLVGDQGSGKSTILQLLSSNVTKTIHIETENNEAVQTYSFDFENDNLRKTPFSKDNSGRFKAQLSSLFVSHGQSVNAVIQTLNQKTNEKAVILMDEPDMALSIRSCHGLIRTMIEAIKSGEKQIICSAHNLVVISAFDSVYSLEHQTWMKSKDFVLAHSA